MNLSEITKEVRKSVSSATEDQVRSVLRESQLEESLVDQKVISLIVKRLQAGLDKSEKQTAIAPVAPTKPSSPIALIDSTPPKVGSVVQDARDRKTEAVESVISGSDTMAARVLEKAREKASKKLEPQIEKVSDRIAENLAAKELSELERLEGFFLRWADTSETIAAIEAEIV